MSTKTSRLIEETLREWDDHVAIDDEELFECIAAPVERPQGRNTQAYAVQPQTSAVQPGYTISSPGARVESRRH